MFVLSRKKDEQVKLRIFDAARKTHTTVVITVAKISRNKIKLRFDAPTAVVIERPDYLAKIGTTSYGPERQAADRLRSTVAG